MTAIVSSRSSKHGSVVGSPKRSKSSLTSPSMTPTSASSTTITTTETQTPAISSAAAAAAAAAVGAAPPPLCRIRVVARIRPLAKYELQNGCKRVISSVNSASNNSMVSDPSDGTPGSVVQVSASPQKRWFELDAVFDGRSTQEDVYVYSGAKQAVCEHIFKGFNCTMLAYGQTGAGKTFTMGTASVSSKSAGNDNNVVVAIHESDGIIPRACHDLFENIQTKCDGNATVELSYLEIYNEEIRDLLVDSSNACALKLRETLNGEVYVSGLSSKVVKSTNDIGRAMLEASQRRVVASTAMNAVSSRSHALCILKVSGVLEDSTKFQSKLTLVDLAGSERIKKTNAEGSRRMEGININKGLFVLGQVVSALSEQGRHKSSSSNGSTISSSSSVNSKDSASTPVKKTKCRKPPYRDSKLTRLLQDSLGGNSQTIMLACISPADFNVDESVNTLRYATSARNIKNTATRNVVKAISSEEAAQLQRSNQLLQLQVAELQETIKKMTAEILESHSTAGSNDSDDDDTFSIQSSIASFVPEGNQTQINPATVAATTITTPTTMLPSTNIITAATGMEEVRYVEATDRIKELEAQVEQLQSGLKRARVDLRRSISASAIELPAMKVQVAHLQEEVQQVDTIEKENSELRKDLQEAKADAVAARRAAKEFSDMIDSLQNMKNRIMLCDSSDDLDELADKQAQLQNDILIKSRSIAAPLITNDVPAVEGADVKKDKDQNDNVVSTTSLTAMDMASWEPLLAKFGVLYLGLGIVASWLIHFVGASGTYMQIYTVLFVQTAVVVVAMRKNNENQSNNIF